MKKSSLTVGVKDLNKRTCWKACESRAAVLNVMLVISLPFLRFRIIFKRCSEFFSKLFFYIPRSVQLAPKLASSPIDRRSIFAMCVTSIYIHSAFASWFDMESVVYFIFHQMYSLSNIPKGLSASGDDSLMFCFLYVFGYVHSGNASFAVTVA